MPAEDKNISKYNAGEKSLKVANIIYMDLKSLLIKQQFSQNNPEKSYADNHEACAYSIHLVKSYEPNKNIRIFYRGKDIMKKLCEDSKTQAMEVINFKEKK